MELNFARQAMPKYNAVHIREEIPQPKLPGKMLREAGL